MTAGRLAPFLIFLAMLGLFGYGLFRDHQRAPSALIGEPLPDFALPALVGDAPGLARADLLAVGDVSLLNVFSSSCPGCLLEHPTLARLGEEGVVPLFGMAWKDGPGLAQAFLDEKGDPYVRAGDDADGDVGLDFGVTGTPETFVVAADGTVLYRHIGPITEEVWRDKVGPIVENARVGAPS